MVRVKTLQVKERSSVVERLVYTQDVVGSIPTVPTKKGCSSVVEHRTFNPLVVGSIPTLPTTSECGAVWLAHLLWEQGVVGSNPTTPTIWSSSSVG